MASLKGWLNYKQAKAMDDNMRPEFFTHLTGQEVQSIVKEYFSLTDEQLVQAVRQRLSAEATLDQIFAGDPNSLEQRVSNLSVGFPCDSRCTAGWRLDPKHRPTPKGRTPSCAVTWLAWRDACAVFRVRSLEGSPEDFSIPLPLPSMAQAAFSELSRSCVSVYQPII